MRITTNYLAKRIIVILMFTVLSISGCSTESQNKQTNKISPISVGSNPLVIEVNKAFPITRHAAIGRAAKELNLTEKERKNLVACDGGIFFRIIYAPEKREITISRIDGEIIGTTQLVQNVPVEQSIVDDFVKADSRDVAIKIAKNHFIDYARKTFNADDKILDEYLPSACDLGDSWRVSFILKDIRSIASSTDVAKLPNHSPPDYLIYKNNGKVIYFNYFANTNK